MDLQLDLEHEEKYEGSHVHGRGVCGNDKYPFGVKMCVSKW